MYKNNAIWRREAVGCRGVPLPSSALTNISPNLFYNLWSEHIPKKTSQVVDCSSHHATSALSKSKPYVYMNFPENIYLYLTFECWAFHHAHPFHNHVVSIHATTYANSFWTVETGSIRTLLSLQSACKLPKGIWLQSSTVLGIFPNVVWSQMPISAARPISLESFF